MQRLLGLVVFMLLYQGCRKDPMLISSEWTYIYEYTNDSTVVKEILIIDRDTNYVLNYIRTDSGVSSSNFFDYIPKGEKYPIRSYVYDFTNPSRLSTISYFKYNKDGYLISVTGDYYNYYQGIPSITRGVLKSERIIENGNCSYISNLWMYKYEVWYTYGNQTGEIMTAIPRGKANKNLPISARFTDQIQNRIISRNEVYEYKVDGLGRVTDKWVTVISDENEKSYRNHYKYIYVKK